MNFSKLFHIRHLFFFILLVPINGLSQQAYKDFNCLASPHISFVSTSPPAPFANFKSINPIGSAKLVVTSNTNAWIFDGKNWDPIEIMGKPIVASTSNNRIIIADEQKVMVLTPMANGMIRKEEATIDISRLGGPISAMQTTSNGDIYFTTANRIWKYENQPTLIDSCFAEIELLKSNKNIYYYTPLKGLTRIDSSGTKSSPLVKHKALGENRVVNVFEIGDTTLFVYSTFPWVIQLKNNDFKPFGEIQSHFKSTGTKVKKAHLSQSLIYLLTDNEGILVLNPSGSLQAKYTSSSLPLINQIEDISITSTQSFLALTASGIYRLFSTKEMGFYTSLNGISSNTNPNHILITGNTLYIANSEGVFYADLSYGRFSQLCFTKIAEVPEEIYWLHESNDVVYAIGKKNIFGISGYNARLITELNCAKKVNRLFTIEKPDGTALIGICSSGLNIKSLHQPQKSITELSLPANDLDINQCFICNSKLYIKSKSNIWFSLSPANGNWEWEKTTEPPQEEIASFGFSFEPELNSTAFKAIALEELESFDNYVVPIHNSNHQVIINSYPKEYPGYHTLWLGSFEKNGIRLLKGLGILPSTEKIYQAFQGPDSIVWISTSSKLNYYAISKESLLISKPSISIFSVSFTSSNGKGHLQKGYFFEGDSSTVPHFQSPVNQLTINLSSFGCSEWGNNHEAILFSSYIEGYDETWIPWTQDNIREVSLLKDGKYTIWAKSMNLMGDESDPVGFTFTVRPQFFETWYALLALVILALIGFYALYRWRAYQHALVRFKLESLINQRTEELVKEKEKTENLLARVLPHDTASELKEKGKVNTQRFKMVTVLFSDIEGFTRITDETNPETLIDQLDKFFLYFDSVVEKYKIEKIKTIGDAYMCAGGIPEKNRTNPVEVILAALEMMLYMKSITSASARTKVWELRIGIDTGPVIAGVVGRSKLTYDIWGSTVNTASRMESSGEAGQINISGNTFMLVKDYFICTFRGKMPVKNKGDIQMYFVNGIKPSLSDNMQGLKPNNDFFVLLQLIRLGDLEDFILEKLEKGLPRNLYYHNLKHTVDVYTQVELIGRSENVTKEEMLLLRTAALFHDAGHLIDYDTHEEMAVKLIREILPEYQYTEEQIEAISQLIMATKMPPNPKNLLEEIMCDADLDYLGRPDFIPVSNMLYKELHEHGKIGTLNDWNELQIKFIDKHYYFTKTARRLRNVNKQSQLDKLKLWMENN